MITLKEWMELCDYRITEGDNYGWHCFGPNAQSLSSWNGNHNGWSMNVVFDTKDQTVYTVEVCDYRLQRAYRMINPGFRQAHDDEAQTHDVDPREAWDDVNFVDLEDDDDFMQKALAIQGGQDYDTRVSIPVTFPDDVLFTLMKQAHEADITFNQHVENILKMGIDQMRAENLNDDWSGWDKLCEDHWDDDDDEMLSDIQDIKPAAMKYKKKKKK